MNTMQHPDYEVELGKLEAMPEEELRELQLKKLQKQLKYCYDNSPFFYKKRFDALGVKPEDIKTWEDFRNLPL